MEVRDGSELSCAPMTGVTFGLEVQGAVLLDVAKLI